MLPVFGRVFDVVPDVFEQLPDGDDAVLRMQIGRTSHAFQQEMGEDAVPAAPLVILDGNLCGLA